MQIYQNKHYQNHLNQNQEELKKDPLIILINFNIQNKVVVIQRIKLFNFNFDL